jgi:hypothetical protein
LAFDKALLLHCPTPEEKECRQCQK